MAILTYGSLTSEVESYLGLKTAIAAGTANENRLILIIKAVEAELKRLTGRLFEQTTYSNEKYDIFEGQERIFLSDYPVTTFTSLKYVSARATDGTETLVTYDANTYVVDLVNGIVTSLLGAFPLGPNAVQANYVAGYTSTQITNNSADEVSIWKMLELSIIAREFGLSKENKRHLESLSYASESPRYRFDLDGNQYRLLSMLTRRGMVPK